MFGYLIAWWVSCMPVVPVYQHKPEPDIHLLMNVITAVLHHRTETTHFIGLSMMSPGFFEARLGFSGLMPVPIPTYSAKETWQKPSGSVLFQWHGTSICTPLQTNSISVPKANYIDIIIWCRTTIQVTWLPPPKSEAQVHVVCRYVAPHGECYYNTLFCCNYFSSSSVVSRAFSVLKVHHPHPLGYFCANLIFLLASVAELAHGEKSLAQSLNHSPSLFDAPRTEALAHQNNPMFNPH